MIPHRIFLGEDIINLLTSNLEEYAKRGYGLTCRSSGHLVLPMILSRPISLDDRSHFLAYILILSIFCGNASSIYMIWGLNQDMVRDQTLCKEELTTDDNFELNGSMVQNSQRSMGADMNS